MGEGEQAYKLNPETRAETYELEANTKAGFGLWANLNINSGTGAMPWAHHRVGELSVSLGVGRDCKEGERK